MSIDHATPPTAVDGQSPAARRARFFGWWFYTTLIIAAPFALLLAAALAVWLWWKWDEMQAARDVKAEVARIQSQNEPVTIYDLYAWHQVPEGMNDTTRLWLAALRSVGGINSSKTDYSQLPIVGQGDRATLAAEATGSTLPLADAFLQENDAAVQAILTAAKAEGHARLPFAFENGSAAAIRLLPEIRQVARLMSLRMRVAVEQGDTAKALESLQANLALVQASEHEPTLVGNLVYVAVVGVALKDIELFLNGAQPSDAELAILQSELQALDIQDSFTSSLVGERGIGFHSFHQFAPPPAPRIATAAQPMADGRLMRSADCRFFLVMMQDYIDASRQPFPKSLQDSKQIVARVSTVAQSTNPLERMRYVLSMQVVPATQAAFAASTREEAVRQLTLTAIAAKRYQLKHGQWPSDLPSLSEFLKEMPTDPYDGQPLRLIRSDDKLIIYSIGPDGRDNGGTEIQDRYDPDIVVELK